MNEEAEIIGKQYYYRKLIRSGKLKIPYETAKKIIGADNAYHLYSVNILKGSSKKKSDKK